MGNNASKQGEKEKERERDKDRDAQSSSPVATHSGSGSTSTTNSRKVPRSGSIRRHQHDDPSRSSSVKSQGTSQTIPLNNPNAQDVPRGENMGNDQSKPTKEEKAQGKAAPVRVPRGSDPHRQRGPDSQFEPSGPPRDPNYVPHSNINYPPRLPLPIEREPHAPGSPIITALGDTSGINRHEDLINDLPRQSSTISSTTVEDDELASETLAAQHEPVEGYVPTSIMWRQGGDKIYVTGTFAQWSTKIRMHRE